MSKGKKAAATAPPPVEAPPPVVVVEEKAPEPVFTPNQQRVLFPKLPIKKIVSYHSSTILANPEPIIELTGEQELSLQEHYQSLEHDLGSKKGITTAQLTDVLCSTFPTIPKTHPLLPELMLKYQELYVPHCHEEHGFSWLEVVQFAKHFVADSFFYGQHLRMYAGRGLASEVLTLLIRGCGINTANGEGLTALHYACEHNKVEIIDVLLQFDKDHVALNAADKYGWTPLHCAVHHGNLPCVKRLLELSGIDIEATNHQGKTPLHLGCAHNRGTIVFYLLTHGANLLHTDQRGMTPLHEAAYRNHNSLYQELIADYCTAKGILKDIAAMADDLGNVPEDYANPPSDEHKASSPISPRNQDNGYPPYPPNSPSNASTTSRTSKGTRLTNQDHASKVPEQPPAVVAAAPAKGKAGKK